MVSSPTNESEADQSNKDTCVNLLEVFASKDAITRALAMPPLILMSLHAIEGVATEALKGAQSLKLTAGSAAEPKANTSRKPTPTGRAGRGVGAITNSTNASSDAASGLIADIAATTAWAKKMDLLEQVRKFPGVQLQPTPSTPKPMIGAEGTIVPRAMRNGGLNAFGKCGGDCQKIAIVRQGRNNEETCVMFCTRDYGKRTPRRKIPNTKPKGRNDTRGGGPQGRETATNQGGRRADSYAHAITATPMSDEWTQVSSNAVSSGGGDTRAIVGDALFVRLAALRWPEVVTVEADNVEFASMGDVRNALEREHVPLHVHLDEGSGINLISEQALEKVCERGIIVTETTALAVPLSISAANETPLEAGRNFVRLPIVFHLEGGTQTIISVQFNIVERLNGSGTAGAPCWSSRSVRRR